MNSTASFIALITLLLLASFVTAASNTSLNATNTNLTRHTASLTNTTAYNESGITLNITADIDSSFATSLGDFFSNTTISDVSIGLLLIGLIVALGILLFYLLLPLVD